MQEPTASLIFRIKKKKGQLDGLGVKIHTHTPPWICYRLCVCVTDKNTRGILQLFKLLISCNVRDCLLPSYYQTCFWPPCSFLSLVYAAASSDVFKCLCSGCLREEIFWMLKRCLEILSKLGAIQHTINYLDALKERFKAAEATSQSPLVTYLCWVRLHAT